METKQASASSVTKFHLENINSTWGTPLKLHSDQGTHYTGKFALFGQFYNTFIRLQTSILKVN